MSNTIAQSLSALQSAKTAIAAAITDKGGTVNSGDGFADFAADIATITGGGGDEALTEEVTRLRKLIDGSATTLIVPSGITSVKEYLCYQSSSSTTLVSVDLSSVTTIGQYAFYNCRAITMVRSAINGEYYIPRTINNVGQYAFYFAGYNNQSTNGYIFHPTSTASVGTYGFYYTPVSKVKGAFSSIGAYAFQYAKVSEVDITCTSSIGANAFGNNPLESVTIDSNGLDAYAFRCTNSTFTNLFIKINGDIGSYAFDGAQYIESFFFDPTSIVSALGSYAFRGLGAMRSETNTFILDFSNSTFTSVGTYAFYPTSTTYPLKNMHITLPSTVATVGAGAFQRLKDSVVNFTSDTPPTISATSAFSNMTNTYITCPYNSINAYRTKANLTTQASIIRGIANNLTEFYTFNNEGYRLTWYTDVACTNEVETGISPTLGTTYYATAGSSIEAYQLNIFEFNCNISVASNGKTYSNGDMIENGTELIISATGDLTHTEYESLTVNGIEISVGDSYTVSGSKIDIIGQYSDGENYAISRSLDDNSWEQIQKAFKAGIASSIWSLGDTKTVTLTNNISCTVMLVDMLENRYRYSRQSNIYASKCVFEFVNNLNTNGNMCINSDNSIGTFADSEMKNIHLDQTIYSLLPNDLKNVLAEVYLPAVLAPPGNLTILVLIPVLSNIKFSCNLT